jgi:hypothetical protein
MLSPPPTAVSPGLQRDANASSQVQQAGRAGSRDCGFDSRWAHGAAPAAAPPQRPRAPSHSLLPSHRHPPSPPRPDCAAGPPPPASREDASLTPVSPEAHTCVAPVHRECGEGVTSGDHLRALRGQPGVLRPQGGQPPPRQQQRRCQRAEGRCVQHAVAAGRRRAPRPLQQPQPVVAASGVGLADRRRAERRGASAHIVVAQRGEQQQRAARGEQLRPRAPAARSNVSASRRSAGRADGAGDCGLGSRGAYMSCQ